MELCGCEKEETNKVNLQVEVKEESEEYENIEEIEKITQVNETEETDNIEASAKIEIAANNLVPYTIFHDVFHAIKNIPKDAAGMMDELYNMTIQFLTWLRDKEEEKLKDPDRFDEVDDGPPTEGCGGFNCTIHENKFSIAGFNRWATIAVMAVQLAFTLGTFGIRTEDFDGGDDDFSPDYFDDLDSRLSNQPEGFIDTNDNSKILVPFCEESGYRALVFLLQSILRNNAGRPLPAGTSDVIIAINFCQVLFLNHYLLKQCAYFLCDKILF